MSNRDRAHALFFCAFPCRIKTTNLIHPNSTLGVVICAKSSDALMANSESACALRRQGHGSLRHLGGISGQSLGRLRFQELQFG